MIGAAAEAKPRVVPHPRALVRSAIRYDELRKLSDAELQAWMQEHPGDASRISAASAKRRRRHEAKHGTPLPLATPEETSHAAG